MRLAFGSLPPLHPSAHLLERAAFLFGIDHPPLHPARAGAVLPAALLALLLALGAGGLSAGLQRGDEALASHLAVSRLGAGIVRRHCHPALRVA